MLIQDLVDPKASFDANNEPKELTPYEARSDVKKTIMDARVSQYIYRESIPASNMNRIYGIIWGKCNSGLQSLLKVYEYYHTKSNFFNSLWLMRETNNITAGIDININKSSRLYHTIQYFINIKQGKTDTNDAFKLHFENIYETMEPAGGYNILRRKKLTKNGSQSLTKYKQ